jgi:arylsulfatase A-like enzyme
MKFRNAYASPQCSPSRVCLQTGQSSPRNGFTVYLNALQQDYYNEKKSKGLPVISCIADETIRPDTTTIPEALKPFGYASAHFGKWHMRGDPSDEGYIAHDGDTDNKPGNTLHTWAKEGEPKPKQLPDDFSDPKLMFSVTERAIQFMEAKAQTDQPFYLQISHYAMHAGSECLPETREKYAKHPLVQAWYRENDKHPDTVKIGEDPAVWLGMAEDLDGRIGAVLDKLAELGIAENTYVVLMSDNGYRHKEFQLDPELTQPMHAHKWWVWQGGIRVPMIVRGPEIEAGSVFNANVVNYDLLPTFVDWAGGDPTKMKDIDGVSLAQLLSGKAEPDSGFRDRFLYFHYPHNRTSMPHSAIVSGTDKVIHFYEKPDLPMLFDLAKDEAETTNIATKNPDRHRELHDEMFRYLDEVRARIPKPNPDFDDEAEKTYRGSEVYQKKLAPYGPFTGTRKLREDEKTRERMAVAAAPSERPPNIVFLFSDDLGWGDLGCYGHPYARTPAIDQLAKEGTRFTQFYVTGVTCCPSRTGFMTGLHTARFQKYPADFGFGDRVTITELLKKRGYRTGHFGKWHIGPEAKLGLYGIDEYSSGERTKGTPRGRDAGLYDAAIEFIQKKSDQPFYVNVWGHATHYPVTVHPDLAAEFDDVEVNRSDFSKTMQVKFDECESVGGDLDTAMREYLGDVWAIDQNVKRLLAAIDEAGLRDNTIIVFSSDHGPAPVLLGAKKESKEYSQNMLGYAGEFRGGKHDQHEGGVRAPFIVRWPGKVKAGHVDSENVISGMDWLPTLARIAGVTELPAKLDGEDVTDIWLGATRERTSPLFWKTSTNRRSASMRHGNWKLHLDPRGQKGAFLYDLSRDPSESNNVAGDRPNVRNRLVKKLDAWMDELPDFYEKTEGDKKERKRKR